MNYLQECNIWFFSKLSVWDSRVDRMRRHLACLVFIVTTYASHHLLLYVVYMCQKSLNFTNAFKCYQRKCKSLHFSWATLYIGDDTKADARQSQNCIRKTKKYNRWNAGICPISEILWKKLQCFPTQNFTEIGQSAAELWPKTLFNMAAIHHLDF